MCTSIGSCIAISSIVKTSGSNVLGSNGELSLSGGSSSRKTGMAISIIWKPCTGQMGGKKFGFFSEDNCQESRQDCRDLHYVHCCVASQKF